MFRMYASNSHSYTHVILALGIVIEPTVWWFITSKYPGIHDSGRAIPMQTVAGPSLNGAQMRTKIRMNKKLNSVKEGYLEQGECVMLG